MVSFKTTFQGSGSDNKWNYDNFSQQVTIENYLTVGLKIEMQQRAKWKTNQYETLVIYHKKK